MKSLSRFPLGAALLALSCAALAHHDGHQDAMAPAGRAQAAPPDGVHAQDCWIRGMPGKLPSAGYFKLVNGGRDKAVLVGASADAYGSAMLHATTDQGGMAAMQHMARIEVPAGGSVEFSPGGYHAMLGKPLRELKPGDSVTLTLSFEQGGALPVQCAVRAPGDVR